jgi:hypothetical protein
VPNGGTTINTTSTTGTVTLSKVKAPLVIKDEKGEEVEVAKWTKMFKWYVQTYHPHIEHEFQAVEDTKENI